MVFGLSGICRLCAAEAPDAILSARAMDRKNYMDRCNIFFIFPVFLFEWLIKSESENKKAPQASAGRQ
jgi:hypothetical protein